MATYTVATPDMTSDTTPSGNCSVDQVFNGLAAWHAFDLNLGFPCAMGSGDFPKNPDHWLEYDFEAGQSIDAYRFYGSGTGYYPVDWTFQGHNGTSWVDLDTVSGNATGEESWSDTFIVASPSATYTKYRMLFSGWESPADNLDTIYFAQVQLLVVLPEYDLPTVNFSFTPQPVYPVAGDFVQLPANAMIFAPNAPSYTIGPVSLTLPVNPMAFTPNALALTFVPTTSIPSTIIYRCTLTGAADSLDDIVLPISSVQARYRNGADSYLQVVVPGAGTYSDAITARLNGQIVIDRGVRFIDGTDQLVELLRVDLETISDAWGGSRRSVSISGHATTTTTVPKTVTLEDVTYESSGTGKTRYRSNLDLNLRPGDTAVFGAQSIVVESLSYTVGTNREIMEITEV